MNPLILRSSLKDGEATYDVLWYWCPAPMPGRLDGACGLHRLQISGARSGGIWIFDGNVQAPTIEGSVLTRIDIAGEHHICHSFIRNGQIEFLTDCTHELAGKTVPMVPLPAYFMEARA